ncbi:type IV secretory system conjugative DNA transfer family protein [Vulcaniibacterium gelatinicum]|uniref:type IV secretory system conjugative DNA transfer family protein n=1 Tax=Vulcaniibacterium gelatinicum TaxID=2598725 RepID=UPI0011CB6E79|nr:type IV secretory system conjugative DNA transfer family protein [Vulcaniibacterium gelatinicum]
MYGLQTRIGVVLALCLLAGFGGLYLSGYFTLALLGLDIPLEWNTYWRYVHALGLPQVQPFAWKIKLAGALGLGVPLLSLLPLAVILLRPGTSDFHGGARFATLGEVKKAGLAEPTPQSVIVGRFKGRHLSLGGTQHILMTAPTRTGKTTSIVIPALLTYQGSVVVADTKGELFQHTSGRRQAMGQAVYRFDPYNERGQTHRFNPFQALSGDPRVRISQVQSIAAILYPDDQTRDPFWSSMARKAFAAFALYLFDSWDDMQACGLPNLTAEGFEDRAMDPNTHIHFPSFERIYRLSTGAGVEGGVRHWMQEVVAGRNHPFVRHEARTYFSDLVGLAEETFSSVLATMQEPLAQFLSPILAAATNASDFDVRDLRRRPMSVYVVVPPSKLGESGKLLNIFFSTALNANLDKTPEEDRTIRQQMLLVMDEFTAMGPLHAFADRISLIAGYWIRALVIVQSQSQLRSVYGPDVAKTLVTNHAMSIVFTPREQEDAEEYSRMLGTMTVRRRNRTVSRGPGSSSVSYAYSEESRPLMRPQELKELSMDEAIIFYEGCKPIRCRKNWYFKSNHFKRMVLDPVPAPALATPRKRSAQPYR